ncbi:hypothetical protein MNBD_IGNAVI01-2270 [hydrothermal vent metagenome]|uniref:Uncharacterized protein n=1 Tax=hydrothermal vent metagenome TaxID=652676 RepID=A0A3B1CY82_9ZZZZ
MFTKTMRGTLFLMLLFSAVSCTKVTKGTKNKTIALWLFDEPTGLYPSHVLDDSSPNDYPLALGLHGKITAGKYGNALTFTNERKLEIPEGEVRFGLKELPVPKGRTVKPLSWKTSKFCGFMTSGENHLRKEVGFPNATDTKLNLGSFDWTVEFWFAPSKSSQSESVIFEIGQGPRGENEFVTRLSINEKHNGFILFNQPSGTKVNIKSEYLNSENKNWHHYAFVYSTTDNSLTHYIDGKNISKNENVKLKSLPHGDEAYMTIGTNGIFENPINGKLDELRFSEGIIYNSDFEVPKSFAKHHKPYELVHGPKLLFDNTDNNRTPILLGNRKHVFIDDAFIEKNTGSKFVVNPPKVMDRVIDNITGEFRKHLTVVEDQEGNIRIYNSGPKDYLQVFVSKDGIHFNAPDVGHGVYGGQKNIVIPQNVGGLGNPFIDPNGPDSERWKYISGYHRRGIYVFTSPDGYNWTRVTTTHVPFRSGTQSCSFYDDQRQLYVEYHRSGIFHTPAGATQRSSVVTQTKDLFNPIDYEPLTQKDYFELDKKYPLREPLPWYLDNGPLTPGGFGMEFPHKFDPIPEDPVGIDLYVTKAQKYDWAPDTYLAFPIAYFHYELDGPITRQILQDPRRGRGSGPIETQIEVSRDGLNWKRYPRPTYVGIGEYFGRDIHTIYMAQGMVKRGNEIWQYFFAETQYHSAWTRDKLGRGVYRTVQRLDGFISLDSPYGEESEVVTKPFIFKGNRLSLNIDTDALGYAQVGFLDEHNKPIPGFTIDDCVYINGDFINTEAEWIKNRKNIKKFFSDDEDEMLENAKKINSSSDVSSLEGKVVKLVFRMRGSKLYSMQFVNK